MIEFMKKAMDWVLEKEADMAKNCYAKPEDIEEQIEKIKERKDKLTKQYNEDIAEFEHIIDKLNAIKDETLKCQAK